MGTNTKKKKFGFWKGLLLIIAVLAFLNMVTDGASTDFLTSLFKGPDSSISTTPTEAPTQPTEDRLPSVPEALRNHVYLQCRGKGACAGFTGDVKMLVIFVSDPEVSWTEERINNARQEIEMAMARIRQDAAAYGASLNLTAEYLTAKAGMPLVRDDWTNWANSALSYLSLPGFGSGLTSLLEDLIS